jgi:hypothetical protein
MPEEDSFYIGLRNPRDFRRELLESNKSVIQLLQRRENLKILRQKKVELMYKFSDVMSEIKMLMGKMKTAIPETKLRNASSVASKQEFLPQNKQSVSSDPIGTASFSGPNELLRLQEDLAAIEKKLSGL